jgi:molybdopterin-guanine dinucleotide biosynthesis protein A
MELIEGFVLVGGRSTRMGRDKSALLLGGRALVDRAVLALRGVSDNIRLVGGTADEVAGWGRVADVYRDWGALGGLHAALAASTTPWAAVLACDLPFVTPELLTRLADLRGEFDAVAPVQADGITQPLCALYNVAICRAQATELIESGERRPIALLQSIRTRWVPFSEIADLDGASHFFDNINTPDDYARAAAEEGQSLPS